MPRKRIDTTARGIQLGLIITPMLDMSFQILAFFLMTYNPSALEANIPGSLVPNGSAKAPADVKDVPPPAAPLLIELPEDVVTVKVTNDAGAPRQVFVHVPPAVDAELIADANVDFDNVAVRRLEARLRKLDSKSAQIKIEADGALRQQYVVAVYDAARRAGFSKIHFVAPRK
jgi:biopolymer transport protein ExbD